MFKKGVIFIDTYQGIVVHLQCTGMGLYMYEGWIHVITSHGHLMHGCCRIVMKSGMLTAEGCLSGYSVLFFVGLKQP